MAYDIASGAFANLKSLKPQTCESCKADGYTENGHCAKCLENQAYNTNLIETNLFIVDTGFGSYHQGGWHKIFKSTPLRKQNEHPFLYYGIEIEVSFDDDYLRVFCDDYDCDNEPTGEIEDILKEFSEITNGMFIYEEDGSLYNGVEFISRPMSITMWEDEETIKMLEKGFNYLKENGALINQPSTNGLHIHISKKFFDYGAQKRNDGRRKAYEDMDWLFQYFQPEIEKIGGREYTQYCASKITKIKNDYGIGRVRNDSRYNAEIKVTGKLKKGGDIPQDDHGSALILSGPTIEARVFNSTIDYKRVLGYIELMRNFSHAVREENINGKTLNNILHTKDNNYLDGVLNDVKKECFKNGKKFDLERVVEDELEIA